MQDNTAAEPPAPPRLSAEFEPVRVLGAGGFGTVRLCRSQRTGELAVLKEVVLSRLPAPMRRLAIAEARTLAKLRHPHIIRAEAASIERSGGEERLFIVLEYAEGGDLFDLVAARREAGRLLSEAEVLGLLVQIAGALKHCHDRKILHRDIKPENVFLTQSGTAKLGDFGICRVLEATGDLATTAIGTPAYASPEMFAGRAYSTKSDMWALGCVVFHLAALERPFDSTADDIGELRHAVVHQDPKALPRCFSAGLAALVRALLHKDEAQRPSVDEVLESAVVVDFVARQGAGGVRQGGREPRWVEEYSARDLRRWLACAGLSHTVGEALVAAGLTGAALLQSGEAALGAVVGAEAAARVGALVRAARAAAGVTPGLASFAACLAWTPAEVCAWLEALGASAGVVAAAAAAEIRGVDLFQTPQRGAVRAAVRSERALVQLGIAALPLY